MTDAAKDLIKKLTKEVATAIKADIRLGFLDWSQLKIVHDEGNGRGIRIVLAFQNITDSEFGERLWEVFAAEQEISRKFTAEYKDLVAWFGITRVGDKVNDLNKHLEGLEGRAVACFFVLNNGLKYVS